MAEEPMKAAHEFDWHVAVEMGLAQNSYGPFNSLHEGLGVLDEEFHEFRLMVFAKPASRNKAEIFHELVQIAAVARRIALDLLEDAALVEVRKQE